MPLAVMRSSWSPSAGNENSNWYVPSPLSIGDTGVNGAGVSSPSVALASGRTINTMSPIRPPVASGAPRPVNDAIVISTVSSAAAHRQSSAGLESCERFAENVFQRVHSARLLLTHSVHLTVTHVISATCQRQSGSLHVSIVPNVLHSVYVPSGHAGHVGEPAMLANESSPHGVQSRERSWSANVPIGHGGARELALDVRRLAARARRALRRRRLRGERRRRALVALERALEDRHLALLARPCTARRRSPTRSPACTPRTSASPAPAPRCPPCTPCTSVLPVSPSVDVPTSQSTHDVWPIIGCFLPAAHGAHLGVPLEAADEPAAHAAHIVEPRFGASLPASHCVHSVAIMPPC
jgi:hypothetical protein